MIPRRTVISLGAIAIFWLGRDLAGAEPATPGPGDCGTLALYHLLHLEGRPIDFDRIELMLGAPTPEGHSFRELREAASSFGLKLDAVALRKQLSAIRHAALVFVKSDRQGHFVVVRPVGHTGRLVQVLDGDRPPVVIDAERLFASPSWTGLALITHRPNYLVISAICLTGACIVVYWFSKRRTYGVAR
jgi:ABC-type bacteriocin/lantibiotic exporter with double-glycine peptidase domain